MNKKVEDMNCKELLKLAKELNITGRHDMKKDQLIAVIKAALEGQEQQLIVTEAQEETKGRLTEELGLSSGIMVENALENDLAAETSTGEWEGEVLNVTSAAVHNYPFARRIPRDKIEYIKKAAIGTIIAFKVSDVKLLSGMIKEKLSSGFIIQTKNGMEFNVPVEAIAWVKSGRWPKGIYEALKGIRSA